MKKELPSKWAATWLRNLLAVVLAMFFASGPGATLAEAHGNWRGARTAHAPKPPRIIPPMPGLSDRLRFPHGEVGEGTPGAGDGELTNRGPSVADPTRRQSFKPTLLPGDPELANRLLSALPRCLPCRNYLHQIERAIPRPTWGRN